MVFNHLHVTCYHIDENLTRVVSEIRSGNVWNNSKHVKHGRDLMLVLIIQLFFYKKNDLNNYVMSVRNPSTHKEEVITNAIKFEFL